MLVDSTNECAAAVHSLLLDPDRAHDIAHQSPERVRRHFLGPQAEDATARSARDAVCGFLVAGDAPEAAVDGHMLKVLFRNMSGQLSP